MDKIYQLKQLCITCIHIVVESVHQLINLGIIQNKQECMPCVHNKHKHKAALAAVHYYQINVTWLTALITINLKERNQAFSGFLFPCK